MIHRQHFGEVVTKLRAKGFDCEMDTQFLNLGFKASSNSVALFHNAEFEELQAEVGHNE